MRRILATLSIIPSFIQALLIWIITLPILLWDIPKRNYNIIMSKRMVLVKVKKNNNGTYTIYYKGKEKTITEEEFRKKTGGNIEEK